MKTVVCRLDLGYTRVAGYTLYDDVTEEFHETTPREVKELIRKNRVNGLKLADGEIVLDEEGFNQRNLMIKSAVGKYRPLYDTDSLVTRMYAVLDVVDCGGELMYEVITNYCGRKLMTEEFVRTLSSIGYVAGVIITDEKIKLLNKKFSNQSNEEKHEKEDEYRDIDEISEADDVLSIGEEVILGKIALEDKVDTELKEEVKLEEKVIEVTNIEEGSVDKADIEPEKLEFTSSEVEMAEVKEEGNVEQTVENENQTEDDGVQTSDDQDKTGEEKEVTHKKRSRAKK